VLSPVTTELSPLSPHDEVVSANNTLKRAPAAATAINDITMTIMYNGHFTAITQ